MLYIHCCIICIIVIIFDARHQIEARSYFGCCMRGEHWCKVASGEFTQRWVCTFVTFPFSQLCCPRRSECVTSLDGLQQLHFRKPQPCVTSRVRRSQLRKLILEHNNCTFREVHSWEDRAKVWQRRSLRRFVVQADGNPLRYTEYSTITYGLCTWVTKTESTTTTTSVQQCINCMNWDEILKRCEHSTRYVARNKKIKQPLKVVERSTKARSCYENQKASRPFF